MSTHWHFVGIGGIGMSGLAQMARSLRITVSGSDRGSSRPENAAVFAALQAQGIRLYPQDGSFVRDGMPDALVYSTAIEEDNPDFAAGANLPRLHRAAALEMLMKQLRGAKIAITGSCGKSSVTAQTADALAFLGRDPGCLNGAPVCSFRDAEHIGNFRQGGGNEFVFEADESDKSLINYDPDYAIVLNIGTDHYDKEELARVFTVFLQKVKKGVVLGRDVYESVKAQLPKSLAVKVFEQECGAAGYAVQHYTPGKAVIMGHDVTLTQGGFHSALNALAVVLLLKMLGIDETEAARVVGHFGGVGRRFDRIGTMPCGAEIFDDYAHNPEKITACLRAAQERAPKGKVLAVFQPHGFGPWGFMHEELHRDLLQTLRPVDRFYLLEPYYAGGTSSMRPKSSEIAEEWRKSDFRFEAFPDRDTLQRRLQEEAANGDVVVIMGARDNSLPLFGARLTR